MTIEGDAVITIPSVSNQTVWLPVSDVAPDGTVINPTTGGVDVSFTGGGDPTAWTTAAWYGTPVVVDGSTFYLVEVGIGSAGLAIPKGYWFLWLKLKFVTPNTIIRHSSIYIY